MKFSSLLLLILFSCAQKPTHTKMGVTEALAWYGEEVDTTDDPQLKLDVDDLPIALDIRGVGDSAWSYSATPAYGNKKPRPADFDLSLAKYDPRKEIFVGDLSFINFETVVGIRCDKIRQAVSFYFLTDPASVTQAINHGFNLHSYSNNHSQDCEKGRATLKSEKIHGPLMTEESMKLIPSDIPFIWNGVGSEGTDVTFKEMTIKGKTITVALGAISLIDWNIPNSRFFNLKDADLEAKVEEYLKQFTAQKADLRILSIHTQDASGYKKPEALAFLALKRIGLRFVHDYNGDIVFGHGPHSWGGVRYLENDNGKQSVIFTSMGNFIHYGLSSNPDNYIGRVLLDYRTMRIKQVQVIPFLNNRKLPMINPDDPKEEVQKIPTVWYDMKELRNDKTEEFLKAVHANFEWRVGTFTDHENRKRGLYFATFE